MQQKSVGLLLILKDIILSPRRLARNMQAQYSRSIGTSKIRLNEGDLLCKACFYRERARLDSILSNPTDNMEIDETNDLQHDLDDNTRDTIDVNMHWDDAEDEGENAEDDSEECFYPPEETQQKSNKQKLNSIFELLGISSIVDV